MTRKPKTASMTNLAIRVLLFVIAIAAVGYLGVSTNTLHEIWQVFDDDGPAASQPAE